MAAVACAATLGFLEPHMTGPGGDMFALFYDAKTGTVQGINGSGRSSKHLSYEELIKSLEHEAQNKSSVGPKSELGVSGVPSSSIHSVTVPGAVAGWVDTIENFGNHKLTLSQIFEPVIKLAREGVQIPEVSAGLWQEGIDFLKQQQNSCDLLISENDNGTVSQRGVFQGELFKNEALACTYERIAKEGKKGFYSGKTAQLIIDTIQKRGGKINYDDLEDHESTMLAPGEPISTVWPLDQNKEYDLRIFEIPPNGQGIVALQTLAILRVLQKTKVIQPLETYKHNSPEYLHILVEALKSAFRDVGTRAIADLQFKDNQHLNDGKGVEYYLSDEYIEGELAKSQNRQQSNIWFDKSSVLDNTSGTSNTKIKYGSKSDTVYLTATDQWGNACSLINSVYGLFGSGIVPSGLGFPLQNRGANFNLIKGTINCYEPNKRPYHTIIPAMVTKEPKTNHLGNSNDKKIPTGKLFATYGVMGGFMQPQGHVQILLNMSVFGMNEQEALDAPRICLMPYDAKKEIQHDDAAANDESEFSKSNDEAGSIGNKTLKELGGTPGGPTTTPNTVVGIEDGVDEGTVKTLEELGHKVLLLKGSKRGLFGRGQVIRESAYKNNSGPGPYYSAGSDPRGDGAAIPQLF